MERPYDTNVTVAPEGELISKEDTLRSFSDIRFIYWAENWKVSSNLFCGFNYEVSSYNNINFSTNYEKFWGTITLPIKFSYTWLDRNFYNNKISFGISKMINFFQFSIEEGYQNYQEPISSVEDRDGFFTNFVFHYKKYTRKNFIFYPIYFASYYNTSGKNWKHLSTGINIFTTYRYQYVSLLVIYDLMWNHFLEENTFFEKDRDDIFIRIGIITSLWSKKCTKFNFSYTYMKNFSNIYLYEYNRSIFSVSIDYIF